MIIDYYPFGMMQPGRKFITPSGYRYGFNGQEKSTEINEAVTTAEFWEYDSRVGRRWNLDPIPKTSLSNYSVLGDNPIRYLDPSGADFYKDQKGNIVWNNHHGKVGSKFKIDGKKYTDLGTSVTIRTNSEIRLPNDIAGGDFSAGTKLLNYYTITGNYDKNGKFVDFTSEFRRITGVTDLGVYKLKGAASVEGTTNDYTPVHANTFGGWDGSFRQHTQVNEAEAPGLKMYTGGNLVDVNVGIFFRINPNGEFYFNVEHGTFPSVRIDMQTQGQPYKAVYDYYQASFTFSHVSNYITALATIKKANLMFSYQHAVNEYNKNHINQSWVRFIGFNAGN